MADEVHRHQQRIHQYAFRRHRMGGHTGKADFCRSGVKVLVNNFANFAAVDGPGEINVEASEIQRFRAAQTDLFIRHKGHHNIPVLMFRRQVFQHRHYYRHGGFIICA
ncbi:hypothetical protein D3C85_1371570 [compost metagenome]